MDVKISAKDVKELRDISGAGMMDCKKALTEAAGNIEEAIAILRKKGQKLSAKRADRDAKEGAVIALTSANRNNGIIVRLSCETDFVGKGEAFINLATSIGEVALKNLPDTLEDLLALPYDAEMSVGDKVTEQVGVFGEKVEVKAYEKVITAAGEGQVLPYIHMGNRAAVLVALNMEGPDYIESGKNVAMQVAAMKPLALNKDSIDPIVIEKEMEINMDQARQLGKPEAMLERIASGKMNKFFKENTLMAQVYVKDGSMTVESYLQSAHKDLTVIEFKHVALG
jgi:elongation factor Ts